MNFFKTFKKETIQIFEIDNLILKPISKNDIEQIRLWRNEQVSFLRQTNLINSDEQTSYFNDIVYPNFVLEEPKMILLSIFDKISTDLIGYGGFVHIDWKNKTSEVSFLCDTSFMNNPKIYKSCFLNFMKIIIEIAREELQFKCLYSETFEFRKNHIKNLESLGYTQFGIKKNSKLKNGISYSSMLHQNKLSNV